ncbi:MAG: nucleotidyltransferase family protein [Oscillospiraceae bacterium]|nr:nucleotidyltransferase family protein [Oscillospiraceae bacterium]
MNGITPDPTRLQTIDLPALYCLAKFHSVRAAVCIALERAGIHEDHFYQAYKKAVHKNILFDMERTAIFEEFEKHGIWYMPLKGSILKDLYPETGMREMSDNDVLYDADFQMQVKEIMVARGYTAEIVGIGNQDVYKKQPVLNFEMHTSLVSEQKKNPDYAYYHNIRQRLRKDTDNQFGYHFTDEDFYVFMTDHEWKHFSCSGTGIRSLLDCYLYCKVKGDSLDWDYITQQCSQLGFADFEQERRALAMKVFSTMQLPELHDAELALLMEYLIAGTYGTVQNRIKKGLASQSKAGYILHMLFPSMEYLKNNVGFVRKLPVLYPVGVVYRFGRALVSRSSYMTAVFKSLRNNDGKKTDRK